MSSREVRALYNLSTLYLVDWDWTFPDAYKKYRRYDKTKLPFLDLQILQYKKFFRVTFLSM